MRALPACLPGIEYNNEEGEEGNTCTPLCAGRVRQDGGNTTTTINISVRNYAMEPRHGPFLRGVAETILITTSKLNNFVDSSKRFTNFTAITA